MIPLQCEVLKCISNKLWIFDRVQNLFDLALQERCLLRHTELSTLELTLLTYSNMNIKINGLDIFMTESNFTLATDFKRLSEKVYPLGSAGAFNDKEEKTILETISYLRGNHKDISNILTSVFKCFFRIKNSPFCGASHPHAFGMYFVGDNFFNLPLEERCLSFVHELAHQEMFLIQLLDRLVESSADYSLVHAPYQGKERPPIGRLHSLAALARMLQYSISFNITTKSLHEKFEINTKSFKDGELTDYGIKLVDALSLSTQSISA